MADDGQNENGGSSTALKAAVAAAATGAAVYGIRRVRAGRDAESDGSEKEAKDRDSGGDESGSKSKREELTQTLSSKAVEAKKAASKLKPGSTNQGMVETAWGSAGGHVVPVAKEAASSLGAAVARKAPDIVRDELIPGFIEGFEKER